MMFDHRCAVAVVKTFVNLRQMLGSLALWKPSFANSD